jgi:hypothetical protein
VARGRGVSMCCTHRCTHAVRLWQPTAPGPLSCRRCSRLWARTQPCTGSLLRPRARPQATRSSGSSASCLATPQQQQRRPALAALPRLPTPPARAPLARRSTLLLLLLLLVVAVAVAAAAAAAPSAPAAATAAQRQTPQSLTRGTAWPLRRPCRGRWACWSHGSTSRATTRSSSCCCGSSACSSRWSAPGRTWAGACAGVMCVCACVFFLGGGNAACHGACCCPLLCCAPRHACQPAHHATPRAHAPPLPPPPRCPHRLCGRQGSTARASDLGDLLRLRLNTGHLISNMQIYLQQDVIEASYATLQQRVAEAQVCVCVCVCVCVRACVCARAAWTCSHACPALAASRAPVPARAHHHCCAHLTPRATLPRAPPAAAADTRTMARWSTRMPRLWPPSTRRACCSTTPSWVR